jgi:phosphoribosylglycinamide formyltransferase-1
MAKKINVGVLASGRGSNLLAIIDSIHNNKLDAEITVVICDVESAYALERARKDNIKGVFVDLKSFPSKKEFEDEIIRLLKENQVELVCLAGFMRVLSSRLVSAFKDRILNIHPSLLPSFPGLHVQKKALEYGVKFSGCTVHFVDEGVDTGPIIIQAVVPILDNDTEESLSERILEKEHKIYSRAIQLIAEKRIVREGRRVLIRDFQKQDLSIINPPLDD